MVEQEKGCHNQDKRQEEIDFKGLIDFQWRSRLTGKDRVRKFRVPPTEAYVVHCPQPGAISMEVIRILFSGKNGGFLQTAAMEAGLKHLKKSST